MDDAALHFANEAFYRAFADRDLQAMQRIWAEDAPTVCIHPGWAPLIGRSSVLESWNAILGGPHPPAIVCRAAKAYVYGDFGLVLCFEQIGADVLVATNGFVRRGAIWRMVHHQAGPLAQEVPEDPAPPDMAPRH